MTTVLAQNNVFEIIYAAVSVVHSFSILNSVLLEECTMVGLLIVSPFGEHLDCY